VAREDMEFYARERGDVFDVVEDFWEEQKRFDLMYARDWKQIAHTSKEEAFATMELMVADEGFDLDCELEREVALREGQLDGLDLDEVGEDLPSDRELEFAGHVSSVREAWVAWEKKHS